MATILQERIAGSPALAAATAELATRLRAYTVEVQSQGRGHGSGVIWRADGLIVTNHHVVHSDRPVVVLSDGRSFPARITGRDPERDLAALRVEATDLPAAPIGDSSALRVGQLVLAMGHPLGIKGALTMGILHAVSDGTNGSGRWVQADVSLAPGNSGGPLVDAQGRVIGINSMIAGGLALAIPSNAVERFLGGDPESSFLGIQTQAVVFPAAVVQHAGQQSGLMILSLVEHSPAMLAGLLPGDILLTAGRRQLTGAGELLDVLREIRPGTPLPLTVLRGGEPTEVTAIVGRRVAETP